MRPPPAAGLRTLLALTLLLLPFAPAPATAAPAAWPHDGSDLAADPAVTWGRLPNGLRYAVLPNQEPRDRVSLRLFVRAGSFHETERQLGLAHFLEHMAFNGSTHFPPGRLIEYFQRIGMGFGNDTNAYTTYDHTAYQLELPNNQPATLDEGLKVLADYAGGLLLLDSEIDRERGIILAEKRDRDSAAYRQFVAEVGFLLPGSLVNSRHTIGTEEVLRSAKRADFVDFYDTWYRPDRMVVVAVGALDPADFAARLASAAGALAARAPSRPDPVRFTPPGTPPPPVRFHREAEAPAATVSISVSRPWRNRADSTAKRRADLVRDVALELLSRRLARLAREEGAPFSAAQASAGEFLQSAEYASVELTCRPEQWTDALRVAENELRRALRFGFDATELETARAARLEALENAVRTAPTRRSPALADGLVRLLASDRVFTSPEADRDLLAPLLRGLRQGEVHEALKAAWSSTEGQRAWVTGNIDIPGGDAAVARTLAAARAVEVSPPAEVRTAAWAYTSFGPQGTIARRTEVADHGVTLVRFANDVRLNLKRTDFEAGRVRISARIGYGRLVEPPAQPGLAFLTDLVATSGGLGRHDFEEIRRLTAGRTVSIGLSTDDDAFVVGGVAASRDLEFALQLATAYVADPGFRPDAFRIAQQQLRQVYDQVDVDPGALLQVDFFRAAAGGDHRFGLPRKADALARTMDEVRAWLAPALASGPIEIALVGDLDVDAAIDLVSRTFGSLSDREPRNPPGTLRLIRPPADTERISHLRRTTATPKSMLAIAWTTADQWDIGRARRLGVLADVFQDRLRVRIREDLGAAYSPAAFHAPSDTYDGFGTLQAIVEVDPAQLKAVRAAVLEVAADLAKGTITEDETQRAVLPIVTGIQEAFRTNPYWLGSVLASAQEYPQRLEWPRSIRTDFPSITAAEINALAAQYLARPAVLWDASFVAVPKPAP